MSNKVLITNSQKAVKVPSGLRILIRRACNAVLEFEHFEAPAEISVTFVDNAAIAELNNQYRNKPMPTDVLSFHSMLHLLGYDHENGGLEAMRMREKEEAVLLQLGLPRTVSYTE